MSEDLPDRMPGGRGGEDDSDEIQIIRVVLSSLSPSESLARKKAKYMPDRMSEYMSDRMFWWGSLEVSNLRSHLVWVMTTTFW